MLVLGNNSRITFDFTICLSYIIWRRLFSRKPILWRFLRILKYVLTLTDYLEIDIKFVLKTVFSLISLKKMFDIFNIHLQHNYVFSLLTQFEIIICCIITTIKIKHLHFVKSETSNHYAQWKHSIGLCIFCFLFTMYTFLNTNCDFIINNYIFRF